MESLEPLLPNATLTAKVGNSVAEVADAVADMDGSYLSLSDADFRERIRRAYARMSACDLCPRQCGADAWRGRSESAA